MSDNKPIHIVITTINVPNVVRCIEQNAREHKRLECVKVWIVGDLKTPEEVAGLADEMTKCGLETVYLDLAGQQKLAGEIGPFYGRLPLNNECRRNIGYLAALRDGCQVLLAMDDDNFPDKGDFLGCHLGTGRVWTDPVITEVSGFHNICSYLRLNPQRVIFPRGFPFKLRSQVNRSARQIAPSGARIGVTAGLWLREPDIDAITWLNGGVEAMEYMGPSIEVLSQDTWTPINTQNTSVVRELIPAFICVPMGWSVPGGKIQRYGDIWGGYFLQALAQGTDYHVAFGAPVVEHRRNPHEYLDDLRGEYWGIMLTDWLVGHLRNSFRPSKSRMTDRVDELASFLVDEARPMLPAWCPPEVAEFMDWTSGNLRYWAEACRRVDG
jgi:hypothetical protein